MTPSVTETRASRLDPAAVMVNRPRGLPGPGSRVRGRIIADLNALAGPPPQSEEESKDEDAETRRVHHRKRLAEPDSRPGRLSVREERALLRALLDRPPYDRD